MCAERLAVGLAVLGFVLCAACSHENAAAPAIRTSGSWTGRTTPTGHAISATSWTMVVGPVGDGSQFEAVGTCAYDSSSTRVGMYRLLGQFDGYFMTFSGSMVGINIMLQGSVVGDSLTGTYTGTTTTPCFVYSGTFQGSDK